MKDVRLIGRRCAGGEAVLIKEGQGDQARLVLKVPGRPDERVESFSKGAHKVRVFGGEVSPGLKRGEA